MACIYFRSGVCIQDGPYILGVLSSAYNYFEVWSEVFIVVSGLGCVVILATIYILGSLLVWSGTLLV